MKEVGSRAVCFMIALILLLSGMCSQSLRADSSFVNVSNTSEADSICKGIDFSYEKNCTNQMVTGMRDCVAVVRKVYSRLNIKSILNFLWVKGISSNLRFYYITAMFICSRIMYSETAILKFIHGQDGKK